MSVGRLHPRCPCPHCGACGTVPDRAAGLRKPCEFCYGTGSVAVGDAESYIEERDRHLGESRESHSRAIQRGRAVA